MSIKGPLHLAWRYVAHYRARTALLALALGLTLALPLAVRNGVVIAQHELRARAEVTPLVLGAKGSALELTLNALYFRRRGVESIPAQQAQTIRSSGLAEAIPLYVRFHAQEAPIVGTSLDYFPFRKLSLKEGRMIGRLGDCVIGARLAQSRGLKVGGALYSSPEQLFDIAGVYPLKMRVTGILAPNHSADDDAAFVDVKTAWLIEGIAHGHDDVVKPTEVLEKKEGNVAATNAVRMFSEVTDANFASFHFHGDATRFPLSAVLVVPRDAKAQALLLGRYQKSSDGTQLVRPEEEMDALMATLIQAEKLALVLLMALGLVVLLIAGLVFALSFKMRHREFATLEDIGVSHGTLAMVKVFEVLMIGVLASFIVIITSLIVQHFGASLVRLALS